MVEIHATYDKRRLEKLGGMFDGELRRGNMTLYVQEHFNLKRICDSCGQRTGHRVAVPSVIIEGPTWVLPISVRNDGQILIDLEKSIPDQSNFLTERITDTLSELGIVSNPQGRTDEVVPIAATREAYFSTLRKNKAWDYKNVRKHFKCSVITDASPDDVLKWDTEVEYDYEMHWSATPGDRSCGFNVEAEYFQWLAKFGQLVVARISDEQDATVAMGYCVPETYELVFVTLKRRHGIAYRKYGLGNALYFMFFDHIYDRGLLTPLNLRSAIYKHNAIWHPIPVFKPRLEFLNSDARQSIIARFGDNPSSSKREV
jgi:hypothetical protein